MPSWARSRHNHLHLTDAGRELLAEALRRAASTKRKSASPSPSPRRRLLLELSGRFRPAEKG
jgi:DNA-binding MarR family transcriptional regulator